MKLADRLADQSARRLERWGGFLFAVVLIAVAAWMTAKGYGDLPRNGNPASEPVAGWVQP